MYRVTGILAKNLSFVKCIFYRPMYSAWLFFEQRTTTEIKIIWCFKTVEKSSKKIVLIKRSHTNFLNKNYALSTIQHAIQNVVFYSRHSLLTLTLVHKQFLLLKVWNDNSFLCQLNNYVGEIARWYKSALNTTRREKIGGVKVCGEIYELQKPHCAPYKTGKTKALQQPSLGYRSATVKYSMRARISSALTRHHW